MGLRQLIVVATGFSLDVFAYCLYKGAMISSFHRVETLKMVGVFTGFQTGMMLAGNAITRIPAIAHRFTSASVVWTLLAALTFFSLGIYMIIKSVRKERRRHIVEQKQDDYNYHRIAFWAFLASIDALIAGVGSGFMGLELLATALIVAAISAAAGFVGMACGYWLGCGPMNRFVTVGGCLVLVGGMDLLIHYMTSVF